MDQSNDIQSLPELALQYGTITPDQFSHIQRIYSLKKTQGNTNTYDRILLTQKFATTYQVELLKLIQQYLIVKKRGEEFGKIAVEKGFATREDVDRALELQRRAFKKAKIKKLIGDILVESRVITVKQKQTILKEQAFVARRSEQILAPDAAQTDAQVALSEYEKRFLQIKVLDQEFAACVVEKGFATEADVKKARTAQEAAFENKDIIKVLGDIMVELNLITDAQKYQVIAEQEHRFKPETVPAKPELSLQVSEDNMSVTVTINKNSPPVCLADIKAELENRQIVYGIYPDAILQCHLDLNHTRFVAAKQDLSMDLMKSRKARYLFDLTGIDSQEKKQGEALAEQRLSSQVCLKKDLFGNTVEQKKEEVFTFRCGSGTRRSKDGTKVFAGKSGFPSLSIDRKLYIHPVINVLEDADLRYGPLEPYASINISGVLTGAYPVNVGTVNAEEIRGATINAIGNVVSRIGITDALISAQGDIHARYLHNCRIETFGNVYVENEIIDSQIYCSGEIKSKQCHVLASNLYAKRGIDIGSVGNSRTRSCTLVAGTEHHLLKKADEKTKKIRSVRQKIEELIEKKAALELQVKKNFQKMIELKMFHDRAKTKKETIVQEFKNNQPAIAKEKLKNMRQLISGCEKRMGVSIAALKELNQRKKTDENEIAQLESKIARLETAVQKKVQGLELDIFTFFEWARQHQNIPRITINQNAFSGTRLGGIYSSQVLETDACNLQAVETRNSDGGFVMTLKEISLSP